MTEQETTAADTGLVEAPEATEAPTSASEDFTLNIGVDDGDDDLLAQLDADEEAIGMTPEEVDVEAAPVEESDAQPQEPSEGTEEAPAEDEESVDLDSVAEGELEKALSALRRDGLNKEVLDKMTEEEILALGLKRVKVQADTDDAFRRLKEMEAEKESATEDDQPESEPSEPTDQPELLDLDSAVEPFTDLFGEDAGEAIKGIQAATIKSLEDSVIMPMRQNMEQMGATLGRMMAQETRGRIAEEYPDIKQDGVFKAVQKRAQNLAANGGYETLDAVLWDAARLEFSDSDRKTARDLTRTRDGLRSNGQLTTSSRTMVPTGLSGEERDDLIIDLLEEGKSREEIDRIIN